MSKAISLSDVPELQPFIVSDVRFTRREIGRGSYGTVVEAKIPGATCVVKIFHEALLPDPNEAHGADRMASTFVAECRLMSTVRHPNIVQFLGVTAQPGSRLPALIMEKLLIDLHNLLESNSDIPLSMKHSFLVGVSKGLTYLHAHSPAIIHRDLSARNVLLNSAMVAKIADLGNSRIVSMQPSQLMTMTENPGNMWYMPPEAQGKVTKYNTSIDVFSFGNLSLFTYTQRFPQLLHATETDPKSGRVSAFTEVQRRIESFTQVVHELSRDHPQLVDLIEQCLHNLPSERPPIAKVLARLEAEGEIISDQYSHLNKLEMVQMHKSKLAILTKQLHDHDTEVKRINEAHQLEINHLQQKHREELASLQSQLSLRRLQSKDTVQPADHMPVVRPRSKRVETLPGPSPRSKQVMTTGPCPRPMRSETLPSLMSRPKKLRQAGPAPSKQQQQQPADSLPSAATANIVIPRAVIGKERTVTIQARTAKGEPYRCGGQDVQASLIPPNWAPRDFLEKVEVIHDYVKQQDDELSISVGDVVYVTKMEDFWFNGECNGSVGVFPENCVKIFTAPPVNTEVCDNKDGTYQISFTIPHRGYHKLAIMIDEQPIKGSPFVIYGRRARSCTSLSSPPLQTLKCSKNPLGVAVSDIGRVYVSLENSSFEIFDENGSKVGHFDKMGSSEGEFCCPLDVAIQGDRMYVADTFNNRIQVLTLDGSFIAELGVKGDTNTGVLRAPRSVCLHNDGTVFVADSGNSRVSVFNNDGAFLYHIGRSNNNLVYPCGLALDPSGNLHVADRELRCVKVFSPQGDYITEYGARKLSGALYIAINEEGESFVSGSGGLSVFDRQHNRICKRGLMDSYGVALDKDGHIYVADFKNEEILKF